MLETSQVTPKFQLRQNDRQVLASVNRAALAKRIPQRPLIIILSPLNISSPLGQQSEPSSFRSLIPEAALEMSLFRSQPGLSHDPSDPSHLESTAVSTMICSYPLRTPYLNACKCPLYICVPASPAGLNPPRSQESPWASSLPLCTSPRSWSGELFG